MTSGKQYGLKLADMRSWGQAWPAASLSMTCELRKKEFLHFFHGWEKINPNDTVL